MLVKVEFGWINPDDVIVVADQEGAEGSQIMMRGGCRVFSNMKTDDVVKLLFPPPKPFDPEDVPF